MHRINPVEIDKVLPGLQDRTTDNGKWFQIDLLASQNERLKLSLGIPDSYKVQVYLVQNGQVQTVLNLDEASSFSDRPVQHRELFAPLQLSAGPATVYVYDHSHGDIMLFARLSNERQFIFNDTISNLFNGIIYGIMLTLIPVLTLGFSTSRQISFRLYGLMVLANFLFIADIEGYLFAFIWPNSPRWTMLSPGVFGLLSTMAHILFAMNFLRMKSGMPHLYRLHQFLLGLVSLVIALHLMFNLDYAADVVMLFYPMIACYSALQGIRQGIGAASFYFFGALLLLFFPLMLAIVTVTQLNPFPELSILAYPKLVYLLETVMFGAAVISQMRQFNQHQSDQRIVRIAEIEQLLQAERDKTCAMKKASEQQLHLASVSHDIAQPLASLSFAITALSQQAKTNTLTDHMDNTVRYAQTLLKDLLEKARNEHLPPEQIELNATFMQLKQAFAGIAAHKGLRLSVQKSSLCYEGSPILLYRMLTNLLANALRYTQKGRVVLGARRRADGIEIMVCDSGPGITKEIEEVLLQPFRQGVEGEGYGLGLFIVKNLCQQCGYQLRIRSIAGRGSCFSVFIPAQKVVRRSADVE
ncbi:sensor histidine kinase [Solimicrobium silvestre]|uniref:sensor histidine kinase n=1 Tax=Solimicrobium silvestre TaxID=2099400 RepID=UPI0013FE24B3|nr:sensor histidine kinase [Solimicrobium silvestre]